MRSTLHVERERHLGRLVRAADRRGARWLRRRGERNVTLAGEQAGGRIEADPAGAGKVDLGPGVQVRKVGLGTGGAAVERFHVGAQLDQIAGDEARGKADVAQHLNQQPAGIAARARRLGQRLLGRLDARLEAHAIVHLVAHPAVELGEEVDRAFLLARDRGEELLDQRAWRATAPGRDPALP